MADINGGDGGSAGGIVGEGVGGGLNGNGNGNGNGKLNGNGGNGGNGGGNVRTGGRVGSSHSKIHQIEKPIYILANQWQRFGIHMPDPMPLIVTMGAFAANCLTGDPVWLWLVGPSGSGKTMVLKSLRSLPKTRMVSSISGEAALLSGVKKKDRAKDATGGLLTELGEDGGCLLFMDLTTELSKRKEEITQFFGALREIYDKTYSRSIGGEGGRTIRFEGRVAIIGGVTSSIDRMAGISQDMGQRTMFYRMPASTGYQESLAAVRKTLPEDVEEMMEMSVSVMFSVLRLSLAKTELQLREQLPLSTMDWIVRMGTAAARMRAGVPRDFTNREIVDMVEPELATRISMQMAQLYCGMKIIGADAADRKAALEKVAVDCMPRLRLAVIEEILSGNGKEQRIGEKVQVSDTTVVRTLEDLRALGVAQKVKASVTMAGSKSNGSQVSWGLSDWAGEYLERVLAGKREAREAEEKR